MCAPILKCVLEGFLRIETDSVRGADGSMPGTELTGLYQASGCGDRKEGGSLVHAF